MKLGGIVQVNGEKYDQNTLYIWGKILKNKKKSCRRQTSFIVQLCPFVRS